MLEASDYKVYSLVTLHSLSHKIAFVEAASQSDNTPMCRRQFKKQHLAEWKAAKEEEEENKAAQLVEKQELHRKVILLCTVHSQAIYRLVFASVAD